MKFLCLVSALLFITSQKVNGWEDGRKIAEQRCRNTLCPVDAPPICAARNGVHETFTNSCFLYITNNCDLKPASQRWFKLYDGKCASATDEI